jgi:CubicO group peptidase (beta-lactamase class C family)
MKKYLWLIFCIALTGISCGENGSENNGAENGSYEAFGLDSAKINELIDRIENRTYPWIHSLLIIKDDSLIVERYFAGYNRERIHTLQSVTKSFTSAITAIALDKGFISDTDQKILDFFPQYTNLQNLNEWKKEIRIKDILTMRTGVDYSEGYEGSPHSQLNSLSSGWTSFI